MKILASILALVALCGCGTTNTGQMSHALLQASVTLGEQYALQQHPEAIPYIKAATPVVCAVAHGTNANPAAVVDALYVSGLGTNDTAKLIINGSIALLNIAVASVGGTNQPEISAYVTDVCVGMQNGLPGAPMMAKHANALTSPHLK